MESPQDRLDEKELLAQLKAGDQAAFEHFYFKFRAQLYHKILKIVRIDIISEELLQDLFIKVWQKRAHIDPEKSFKAYLYRIAENLVADHYRDAVYKLKTERELDLNELNYSEGSDAQFPKDLALEAINEAMQTLPDQQRKVFTMAKLEGKSYEEISILMNINKGTINTHMSRAIKHIKAYISEHHGSALGIILASAILSNAVI